VQIATVQLSHSNCFFKLLFTLQPSHPRCNIFTIDKLSLDNTFTMSSFSDLPHDHDPEMKDV